MKRSRVGSLVAGLMLCVVAGCGSEDGEQVGGLAASPTAAPTAPPTPAPTPVMTPGDRSAPALQGSAGWREAESVAANREAQASLRSTVIDAKLLFTEGEDFRRATVEELAKVEAEAGRERGVTPDLTFVASDKVSTGPLVVSVDAPGRYAFYAAAMGADRCFLIRDTVGPSGGTHYATTMGECNAIAEVQYYRSA